MTLAVKLLVASLSTVLNATSISAISVGIEVELVAGDSQLESRALDQQ